jgi:GcrA cell cycle regulator
MWTEQTVETLKKLALEGRSASWIAAALGAPSRSAVIGKANRIGIKLNGAMRSPPIEDESGSSGTPKESFVGQALPPPRSGALAVSGQKRRSDRWTCATADVAEMRRIGFAEVGETECKYPLGDPAQENFAYCGLEAARGRAYCADHCRMVYRRLSL